MIGVMVGFAAKALVGRTFYRSVMPRVTLRRRHFALLAWRARQAAAVAPRFAGERDPTLEVEDAIKRAEGAL